MQLWLIQLGLQFTEHMDLASSTLYHNTTESKYISQTPMTVATVFTLAPPYPLLIPAIKNTFYGLT